jgi:glycosyltransferase involved in cell wall biosynthesis
VARKSSNEGFAREIVPEVLNPRALKSRVLRRLGWQPLSLDSRFPFILDSDYLKRYDIIHLHDLPNGFNLFGLRHLCRHNAVFWTLHSMAPLTGGCMYSYECERWKALCGKCPQFGDFPLHWLPRDASRELLFLKKWTYSRARFYPIGVSQWIAARARESIMGDRDVTVIANPVDTQVFQPLAKAKAKQILGIPPQRKTIWISIASNMLDRRKGVDVILDALPRLNASELMLMPTSITPETEAFRQIWESVPSLEPRHLSTDEELAAYYNAADVVWHPSLADNSPLVCLEAMSCGTPVIAAEVGGVPEIVKDGVNGFLIPPKDSVALAATTQRLFAMDESERQQISVNARQWVEKHHSLDLFIDRHFHLYNSVCANTGFHCHDLDDAPPP